MRKSTTLLRTLLRLVVHLRQIPATGRDACVALLIAGALLSQGIRAETLDERVARAGSLTELHGHRVLRLYGGDSGERGFAHGYLLAKEFVGDLEAAVQSLPGVTVERYNTDFLPWSKANFAWDADANTELDGLFAGMTARLGKDGLTSKIFGRALTRDDLVGMNTLADYFGPACSAFCAWGDRTAGGQVIHGRTLDFPIGAEAVAAQILIVSDALPDRGAGRPACKAFVGVGWPGMITQYTAMNADGLVACMHDGYNVRARTGHAAPTNSGAGFLARGLLLRRILESVDPAAGDAAVSASKLVAAYPSACGNLFQLSWPNAAARKTNTQPSAVLEFDPTDKTPFIRRPENPGYLVLTNHFCVLSPATECARCAHITEGLTLLQNAKRSVGLSEARKLLKSAEQPVAAHSVYFFPDTLEFHVALTKRNVMSPSVAPTKFTFAELFAKP